MRRSETQEALADAARAARAQHLPEATGDEVARPERGIDESSIARGPERRQRQRQVLRDLLTSPGAARQAIILMEILGPPVGLRDTVGGIAHES